MKEAQARGPGIAVLGCGTIASYQHLPNLHRLRSARLVAAADPDAEVRKSVARRYGVPVVATAEELVALAEVDALIIASPTSFHAAHARLATAAAKSFYLEKPLATSAQDARSGLAALAAAPAALVAAVGFNYRFNEVFQEARRLVQDGALGELLAIQMLVAEPLDEKSAAGWRGRRSSGGGAGLDLASHQVDLLRWLFGVEVRGVRSASVAAGRLVAPDQECLAMTLELTGGAEAQCTARFGAGPRDRIEVVGRRATLVADRHCGTLRLHTARRRKYGARRLRTGSRFALTPLRIRRLVQPSWEPSFARALAAFADALGGRDDGPLVRDLARAADGAASLAVILAAEQAAATGRPVAVEPLLPAAER